MRKNSIFSLALLVLVACHHPDPIPGPGTSQGTNQAQNDPGERPPRMDIRKPVPLTNPENDDLMKAVNGTPAAKDSGTAHVHADVRNGQLVFAPEQPQVPSHVTDDSIQVTLAGRNPRTVTVVATPAAKQLLEQRAGQSH